MSGYESVGRTSQKARTRAALKAATVELVATGRQPTVAEVAAAAGISKSTAYRYFPSQELMYAEVVLSATVDADRQLVHQAADGPGDAGARLDRVIQADHDFTVKHEHALRAGTRAFLLLIESFPEVPIEPSHRLRYLTSALDPLTDQVPAPALRRLVAALAMCVGVEAALATQTSCGLSAPESAQVKRWAAAALLRATLDDPAAGTS